MELEMPQSKLQMLTLLRHYWKKGFCVSEAVAQMNAVEGTEFVDESTAKKWFMRFNNGDASLKPRPRYVCDDVWFDVFGFLSHAKLGLILALINCRLDALVDSKFLARKWVPHWDIYSLRLKRAMNGTGAELFVHHPLLGEKETKMPMPFVSTPFRCSIITFRSMNINFVDRTVIEFLHSIKHIFYPRVYFTVNIGIEQKQSWAIVMEQIWPLVPMSECYFRPTNGFPASLLDCAELRLISSDFNFPMAFPCVSNGADQSDEKAATNLALFNWLHMPRADGFPKVFWRVKNDRNVNNDIDQLKQKFATDTSPASYIVIVHGRERRYNIDLHFEAFTMENEQTRECLEFGPIQPFCSIWLLVRRPKMQKCDENWKRNIFMQPEVHISRRLNLGFNDANIDL